MPLDRLAERGAREADLYGFLKKRPEDIQAGLDQTAADTAASRARFASSTPAIIGQLASRFNLPSNIPGAASPEIGRNVEDLKAQEQEALGLEKLRHNQ